MGTIPEGQVDEVANPESGCRPVIARPAVPGRGVNIKLSFVDANPQPRIETFDRLDTTVSYF